MKVVVIGGTGLIGRKVVQRLTAAGHEAVAASPASGVEHDDRRRARAGAHRRRRRGRRGELAVVRGRGRARRSSDPAGTWRRRRRPACAAPVALSIVGADRIPDSGYLRAKVAQEAVIEEPRRAVHDRAVDAVLRVRRRHRAGRHGRRRRPAAGRPAAAGGRRRRGGHRGRPRESEPAHGSVELGGPEASVRRDFCGVTWPTAGTSRSRTSTDPHARYFGAELDDTSLTPGPDAHIGAVHFVDWLGNTDPHAVQSRNAHQASQQHVIEEDRGYPGSHGFLSLCSVRGRRGRVEQVVVGLLTRPERAQPHGHYGHHGRGAHPSAFDRLSLVQKFRHRPSEVFGLLDVAEMPAALEHHEVGALDAGVQQSGPVRAAD